MGPPPGLKSALRGAPQHPPNALYGGGAGVHTASGAHLGSQYLAYRAQHVQARKFCHGGMLGDLK